MNNKLILIKRLQQGGGLEVSPYLQSFLQMYDQPQQPVNNLVAYSVPVIQTSNPIPEDQREEEHPLSFMDNIQRYSGSNYTKVGPKTVKKKKVYPKQQTSVVQSQESKESKESKTEEPKVNKENTQNSKVTTNRYTQNQEDVRPIKGRTFDEPWPVIQTLGYNTFMTLNNAILGTLKALK